MKKLKAFAAALIAGVILTCSGAPAFAASEPGAYGACVSKKTAGIRVLEKTNLSKSLYGSCKSTESKVTLSSKVTLPVVKSLKEQWKADKTAAWPVKPTAEDYAYRQWLTNPAPAQVALQVGESIQLCTVAYKWVKPAGSTTVRATRIPVYSCVAGEEVKVFPRR